MINRNLFILSVGQIFSFTSPVVSVLLSGIIGSAMTEINYLATLPTALMIVGTAFGSLIASKIMKIKGRKFGFSLAAIINSLFSLFCAYAILINSFVLFCLGNLIIGLSVAFAQQYRFAATESVLKANIPKAISLILLLGIVASLLGVVSNIFFKVLNIRQVIRSIDNSLLLLIVTSLALGQVIQVTGTANFLSDFLLNILEGSSAMTIILCFYIFVSITTNFISNNACAVLFAPIAIDIAEKLSVDPKTVAIALIFAVNTSFLTPLAYQTNLLVMGPGHYKFIDYVKFGMPLTILCWLIFYFTFPVIYKI